MKAFNEFIKQNEHKIPDNIMIAIVCNAKSATSVIQDYDSFSIDTEFLSDEELKEIISMASSQRLHFRVFYDERDFLNLLVTKSIDLSRIIVYNSAQNGIGPGRKALIPSLCKYFNIRHTGSDPYRVCLCRDKYGTYSILTTAGLPTPPSFLYSGEKLLNLCPNKKYIAKPIYESASIGITKDNIFIGDKIPFKYLSDLMIKLKQSLIIQEFISGYEIEVPVLSGEKDIYVFPPVLLYRKNKMIGDEILDYERIYNDDYKFASLPDDTYVNKICSIARNVVRILGLKGLCRVDFRLEAGGNFYITDVSTNPHFIKHSSVNFAFKREGLSENDIFRTMLLLS